MAKVVFVIQMLQTFGGRCNRFFRDIRLTILRLPIFNLLYQPVLTKFFISNLFSCLPKVDHVIKSCKEPFFFKITVLSMALVRTIISCQNLVSSKCIEEHKPINGGPPKANTPADIIVNPNAEACLDSSTEFKHSIRKVTFHIPSDALNTIEVATNAP